jgi:hypothetical protein
MSNNNPINKYFLFTTLKPPYIEKTCMAVIILKNTIAAALSRCGSVGPEAVDSARRIHVEGRRLFPEARPFPHLCALSRPPACIGPP